MSDYQEIAVNGFDRDGEPEIKLYPNDKIELMFNFMPPSNGQPDGVDDPMFDRFEEILQEVLDMPVERTDREFFTIQSADPKTATDLKNYLENFWDNYHPNTNAV
jgi:hypothetical protein